MTNKLAYVAEAIYLIADVQDTAIPEIVDALIGVCFDEEEAGEVQRYCETKESRGDE